VIASTRAASLAGRHGTRIRGQGFHRNVVTCMIEKCGGCPRWRRLPCSNSRVCTLGNTDTDRYPDPGGMRIRGADPRSTLGSRSGGSRAAPKKPATISPDRVQRPRLRRDPETPLPNPPPKTRRAASHCYREEQFRIIEGAGGVRGEHIRDSSINSIAGFRAIASREEARGIVDEKSTPGRQTRQGRYRLRVSAWPIWPLARALTGGRTSRERLISSRLRSSV